MCDDVVREMELMSLRIDLLGESNQLDGASEASQQTKKDHKFTPQTRPDPNNSARISSNAQAISGR